MSKSCFRPTHLTKEIVSSFALIVSIAFLFKKCFLAPKLKWINKFKINLQPKRIVSFRKENQTSTKHLKHQTVRKGNVLECNKLWARLLFQNDVTNVSKWKRQFGMQSLIHHNEEICSWKMWPKPKSTIESTLPQTRMKQNDARVYSQNKRQILRPEWSNKVVAIKIKVAEIVHCTI